MNNGAFLCKYRHLETFWRHARSMWKLGVDACSKTYGLGVTCQDETSKLLCILTLGIFANQNWLFQMWVIVFVSATILMSKYPLLFVNSIYESPKFSDHHEWMAKGHLWLWREDSLKNKYNTKYYKIYCYCFPVHANKFRWTKAYVLASFTLVEAHTWLA